MFVKHKIAQIFHEIFVQITSWQKHRAPQPTARGRKNKKRGFPLSLIALGTRFEKATYKTEQSADAESLPKC